MDSLKSLVRMRRHTLEEKQKFLAGLFREVEKFEQRKRDLAERLERERALVESDETLEFMSNFGLFADGVRREMAALDKEIAKLDVRITIAQDDIREAFAGIKRIEIVQKNRETEARKAQDAKETKEMDDIGLDTFRRKEE